MHNNKLKQDILTKTARQIKVTANLESIPTPMSIFLDLKTLENLETFAKLLLKGQLIESSWLSAKLINL